MQHKKIPLVFIIIVIILAAIILVKFSNDKKAIENSPVPTETPNPKLPAGSTSPGDPELIKNVIWQWEKTVMNDDTVVTPKKPELFTIILNKEGNVSGKTDCNGFSGSYQVGSDGIITFGPLAMTKMFCEGSQEAEFSGPISKAKSYSVAVEDGKLLLYFPEGLMILNRSVVEPM